MEVFHCETDAKAEIPLYEGNCFDKDRPPKTQVCKRVLAAWAMGAPPFIYPKVITSVSHGLVINVMLSGSVPTNWWRQFQSVFDVGGAL